MVSRPANKLFRASSPGCGRVGEAAVLTGSPPTIDDDGTMFADGSGTTTCLFGSPFTFASDNKAGVDPKVLEKIAGDEDVLIGDFGVSVVVPASTLIFLLFSCVF